MKYCKIVSCRNLDSKNYDKYACCYSCDQQNCESRCQNYPKICRQLTESRVTLSSGGVPRVVKLERRKTNERTSN